jgi:hypothetical protein
MDISLHRLQKPMEQKVYNKEREKCLVSAVVNQVVAIVCFLVYLIIVDS